MFFRYLGRLNISSALSGLFFAPLQGFEMKASNGEENRGDKFQRGAGFVMLICSRNVPSNPCPFYLQVFPSLNITSRASAVHWLQPPGKGRASGQSCPQRDKQLLLFFVSTLESDLLSAACRYTHSLPGASAAQTQMSLLRCCCL